ncbi:hypothetical protein O1L44_12625 [Streptomyces noursei]|nr:hypothetical protein [Streptomyces noursei]
MTTNREPDGLAELLPQWHRLRDSEDPARGEPLRALLAVIAEQVDRVRDGVAQQYDDWFVETAAEWVLPYLGDLVGYRPLPGYERVLATGLRDGGLPDSSRRRLAEALAPRRDVAATVGNRRRKGTLALLEELSEEVAGWPARAVEFSRLVAHQQPVRLYGSATEAADARRRGRGRLVDVRDGAALDLAGGPFGTVARAVDVRRVASRHSQGGYSPAGVGLFVWRLKPYAVTRAPAYCLDRARNLYTFSILGNDSPLVTRPEPEPSATHLATVDNVPALITRRQLHDRLADYYGPGKSFVIRRDGEDRPVPLADIVVADLGQWRYRPGRGQIAVDPELGRMAFGARSAPRQGVWVDYHYGFGDDLGGGSTSASAAGRGSPVDDRAGRPAGRRRLPRRPRRAVPPDHGRLRGLAARPAHRRLRPRWRHRDHPQRRLPGAVGLRPGAGRPAGAARRRGHPPGDPAAGLVQQPPGRAQHPRRGRGVRARPSAPHGAGRAAGHRPRPQRHRTAGVVGAAALHPRAGLVAGTGVPPGLPRGAEPGPGPHDGLCGDRPHDPRHHRGDRRRGRHRPAPDPPARQHPGRHRHRPGGTVGTGLPPRARGVVRAPHHGPRRGARPRRAARREQPVHRAGAGGPARRGLCPLQLPPARVADPAPLPLPAGPGRPR